MNDDIHTLLSGTVAELEKLLNARNAFGDPVDRDDATVVPVVSYGFGFGVGGGSAGESGPVRGAATGAGGGVRPVGAIIIDKDGARVESVRTPTAGMAETLGGLALKVFGARAGKSRDAEKTGAEKDDAEKTGRKGAGKDGGGKAGSGKDGAGDTQG